MNAIMRWGGAICTTLLFTSISFGYHWATPVSRCPYPVAPDACGPGFYVVNDCGAVYGPNHWVYPPFPPFNGVLPPRNGQGMGANPGQGFFGIYPTHPYVRSPRDFFMWSVDMEDNRGRDIRPNLVVP